MSGRWELRNAAGRPVKVGDMLRSARGPAQELVELEPPHKPDASGRVHVRDVGMESGLARYYASVFDCRYVWLEHRMCGVCGFEADTSTLDEADALHLKHDGAHEPLWYGDDWLVPPVSDEDKRRNGGGRWDA